MTDLIFLTDSYKKDHRSRVTSIRQAGSLWEIILDQTIFYPQGGGQPSDKGALVGPKGKAIIKHVRILSDEVIHECSVQGTLGKGDRVTCTLDWSRRYKNMRVHSAGHVVHEAVMATCVGLTPVKGEHGDTAFIEYSGSLPIDAHYKIEKKANEIVSENLPLKTEFVSLDELRKRASWIPPHLPQNKALRILSIGDYPPIPDGGTHVKGTSEIGPITSTKVVNEDDRVRVYYDIQKQDETPLSPSVSASYLTGLFLECQRECLKKVESGETPVNELRLALLSSKSEFAGLTEKIKLVLKEDRQRVGVVANQVRLSIEEALAKREQSTVDNLQTTNDFIDVTMPGIRPPEGHLHIVTQAIMEITRIFEKIGFTRVRHPEVDWDWYAFTSLNMPPNHPARDEWETFFINYPRSLTGSRPVKRQGETLSDKRGQIVLTPHTSNGQVREMEKGKLPIRMINIAKCYRRQWDISHLPMFHQFEGLYIDRDVSIGDLKGVFDFFVQQFYGTERKTRLRPSHFQFTEPSFEVDILCGVCLGKARLPDGQGCKLCKGGWLELGGAGMVHPVVLRNGGVDPEKYNGFAFGWGIERTYMMKSDTKLDDIRLLYDNDVRFLEQF